MPEHTASTQGEIIHMLPQRFTETGSPGRIEQHKVCMAQRIGRQFWRRGSEPGRKSLRPWQIEREADAQSRIADQMRFIEVRDVLNETDRFCQFDVVSVSGLKASPQAPLGFCHHRGPVLSVI